MSKALIIFTKNLIYGKVKTRLAATIGNDKAMHIYKSLVAHTHSVTTPLDCDKIVYYSEFIEPDDIWSSGYIKAQQSGRDLGERMLHAFNEILDRAYSKVLIIGTDCPSLSADIINEAFERLNDHDLVLGPSMDGGYYLLGMKKPCTKLFENIAWSTATVLYHTIAVINDLNLSYHLLPLLNDIDCEADLEDVKPEKNDQHYHPDL